MTKRVSLYRQILLLLLVVTGLTVWSSVAQFPRPNRPREFFTALNGIRFADQFPGATVGAQIDNALRDISIFQNGAVFIPPSMGPGAPTSVNPRHLVVDFRNGNFSSGLFAQMRILDGTTFACDGDGFNAAASELLTTGGVIVIPAGTCNTSVEMVLPAGDGPIMVWGYGATITTSGAISGLKITGASSIGPRSIYGLRIDHRNNADALFGFNFEGTWNARCYDCTVVADDVSATYAAFRIGNIDPLNGATGAFWTVLQNSWSRRFQAADGTAVPFNVIIEGNANATTIRGGGLNGATTDAVLIRNQGAGTAIPNAVLIDGVAFEGYNTGIHVAGPAVTNIAGMRFINNRFENGTTVFSFTGVTQQPSANPWFSGNMFTSNAGTYLNNPNNLRTNQWDFAEVPAIEPFLVRGITVQALGGTQHAATFITGVATSRGVRLQGLDGALFLQFIHLASGHVSIGAGAQKDMTFTGAGGLGAFFFTPGGGPEKFRVGISGVTINDGALIRGHLSGTASLDFDLSAAGITCQDLTITVTGAAQGSTDNVTLAIPTALASTAGVTFDQWVSAADTVTVRACDVTSGNPDPAAATVRADVWEH